MEGGHFRINYDENGVTGLSNPQDPFRAQMLSEGQRLGLIVRYRAGTNDWAELPANQTQLAGPASARQVIFANGAERAPIEVTQTFAADGSGLDWKIALETTTNVPLEVGDLAISVPVTGPRGENAKEIFEHGFLRHQFISGDGSFLYFV